MDRLPVEDLEERFSQLREHGVPVVLTSPTGSGKSTRAPVWAMRQGSVLVVEPRRVAARSLARRVAAEQGWTPGEEVGWAVRDDARFGPSTRLLFATPGVALRMLAEGRLEAWDTWVLDEFHERRCETDLLFATAQARSQAGRLVLLSATLDGPALARRLGGEHLESPGRSFHVTVVHLAEPGQIAPSLDGLPLRLERALRRFPTGPGTVLAFLPGAGEIRAAAAWLAGRWDGEILTLHGSLSPEEQDRVLAGDPTARRLVLATNVAESALTVPDVMGVLDSGLERRIERIAGLPTLRLGPVSRSSAEQRAGRAGRTRPGVCVRLWSAQARLPARPEAEIRLEDPRKWLLQALACGLVPEDLPWIDRPLSGALAEARALLRRSGLLEGSPWNPVGAPIPGPVGTLALDLPLAADLAAFVLGCRETPAARDAGALACALSSSRPLLRPRPSLEQQEARRNLAGAEGADAALLARLVRLPLELAREVGLDESAWSEAVRTWERLSERLELDGPGWPGTFQTDSVLRAWCRLHPRALRLRRGDPGKEEWPVGQGAAPRLDRHSLAQDGGMPEALVAFAIHGGEDKAGRDRQWIQVAAPLSRLDLQELGLGQVEVLQAVRDGDRVRARWRVRVGDIRLEEREGLAVDIPVWARAVARALDAPSREALSRAMETYWLDRCSRAGRWVEPPSADPLAWLAQRLEEDAEAGLCRPPLWPELPRPPEADAELVARTFPSTLEGAAGLRLHLEVKALEGKLVFRPAVGSPRPAPRDLPRRSGWEGWDFGVGKPFRG